MSGSAARLKGPHGLPTQVSDPARLAAVRDSALVDSPPEEVFDDLARLAASITGVPRAFITVLDEVRSYWKSAIGVGELPPDRRHTAAGESPCHLVAAADAPVIVGDAAADVRLAGIAGVAKLGIGAWAGYPIHSPGGHVLGALCVVDSASRTWTEADMRSLAVLARAVTGEIALRGAMRRLQASAQTSVALARTLQDSLLPPVLAIPPGLDTSARYLPAGQGFTVLGDFYDLFAAGPSRWCAVLGDVSGHGVDAAKVTALARYTVRADAPHHVSPAKVLEQLNTALLAQHVTMYQFLTAICAVFRTEGSGITGQLSTAGHPSALLRRTCGQVEEIRSAGAILGIFPDAGLSTVRFTLQPGETLLFYTDGVTEAHPPANMRLFGEERLHDLLADCHDLEAAAIVERISDAVMTFCAHDPADDIALLVVRVPHQHEPAPADEERKEPAGSARLMPDGTSDDGATATMMVGGAPCGRRHGRTTRRPLSRWPNRRRRHRQHVVVSNTDKRVLGRVPWIIEWGRGARS